MRMCIYRIIKASRKQGRVLPVIFSTTTPKCLTRRLATKHSTKCIMQNEYCLTYPENIFMERVFPTLEKLARTEVPSRPFRLGCEATFSFEQEQQSHVGISILKY